METEERNFISKYRYELINTTICNVELLTILESNRIIAPVDRQQINACNIALEKAEKLYDILETRKGSFSSLLLALETTKQSGAQFVLSRYYREKLNIGTLEVDESSPLDPEEKDSENYKVFKGTFGKRQVAVKKVQRGTSETAENQWSTLIDILTSVDGHSNIIRYFTSELINQRQIILFVFEQCQTDLESVYRCLLESDTHVNQISNQKVNVVKQIASGLSYIHSRGILHLNLRPTNILITSLSTGQPKVKISNFSHAQHFEKIPGFKDSCMTSIKVLKSCKEWLPREILRGLQNAKKYKLQYLQAFLSTDAFSLSCIIYYVLTNGIHPYGDFMERTGHILSTDYSVSLLGSNLFEGYCGECGNNLISQLLNTDFKQRIQSNIIDSHNFLLQTS